MSFSFHSSPIAGYCFWPLWNWWGRERGSEQRRHKVALALSELAFLWGVLVGILEPPPSWNLPSAVPEVRNARTKAFHSLLLQLLGLPGPSPVTEDLSKPTGQTFGKGPETTPLAHSRILFCCKFWSCRPVPVQLTPSQSGRLVAFTRVR